MKKGKNIGLSAIIFVLYSVYYISGYSSSIHNYIIVALFLSWNAMALIEDRRAYSYAIVNKPFAWLLLFVVYYFFTSIIVADFVYTLEYVIIFMCLYGTMIQYRYYLFRNNIREIHFIVRILISAFVVFSILAILFYIVNPSAARILAADYYAFNNIAIGGGYSIAFGSSVLAVYFFELVLRRHSINIKLGLVLVLIILFEVLLIKTESATTLIANLTGLVIGIIGSFYVKQKGFKGTKLISSIFLIVLFFVIICNYNKIGKFIMDITVSGTENVLIRRFNRIGQKLLYAGTESGYTNYVDERLATIELSWNTFLRYPILGVGHKCGNIFSLLEQNGVGTHSEVVDVLAQHGIVGFTFWSIFIISSLKKQFRESRCIGWYLTLLIMMIFNPFRSFHGYVSIFFIIPMIEFLIGKRKGI